jgi:lamin tail-like protein
MGGIMLMKAAVLATVLGTVLTGAAPAVAGPATPPASSPRVVIHEIWYNSPGPDRGSNSSLNAEWVELHNTSGQAVTLTHWTLRDRAGHVFKFAHYRLNSHGYVKIHTGSGSRSQANRYWNMSWYVWNNDGDGATLKNASGDVIGRCSYSDPSESYEAVTC